MDVIGVSVPSDADCDRIEGFVEVPFVIYAILLEHCVVDVQDQMLDGIGSEA
jgi:hypothetical protein